ncbi:MAG: Trk system potassium transporter TrkA [Deltaproteobacteria bacterium]|nr:Trk system potassium transporter TrkA [Deltaproteobacteria bacterium]
MKVIIIGAGVVGYTIARRLSSEAQDVVIIEKDERRIREVAETLDVKIIHGSGSSPKVLMDAGVERSDIVIAVTDSDAVKMIACLIAGSQSRVPKKIARIREPDYASYTQIFEKDCLDLDFNINPEKAAAERILNIIEVQGAVDVADFADGKVKLVGIKLTPTCGVVGQKLKDLKEFHPDHKVIIVAIYRGSETIIPDGSTVFEEGDLVFTVTVPKEIQNLVKLLGRKEKAGNKVMLVGGGDIGFYLAQWLEKKGFSIKVIERNESRALFIADRLKKSIVIKGDGTDQNLLIEENVRDIDTFISVTNDEEANILTALLAKRMGAGRCISLIDKPEYLSMVSTIGIDVGVSPRLASVSGILQFVRRGKILAVTQLMEERVEAIETIAMETSDIVSKPLKGLKFPQGALIGAVVKENGAVVIPEGETLIQPGDKVIIFTLAKTVSKIEKMLLVKPEYF